MSKMIVFSGAGLSAESGLATFRASPTGLWNGHDIDKVCNFLTWKQNFKDVHAFYNARRSQLGTVEPNAAHQMIADWQKRYETVILTQNVDDLLERAGCTDVIHLHGRLTEMRCTACGHVWDIGYTTWGEDQRCPNVGKKGPCNSHKGVKPNVVFFHEDAPHYADLQRIIIALDASDVVVVTGTSEQVIPIGGYLLNRPGYKFFNAMERTLSAAYNAALIMPATVAMPLIDERLPELMT